MYQSRASIVTYLAFTVLVGLGGTGFLMYYSTELQPEDSHVAITYQRPTPQVLGIEVEGSGLTTSEVFEVFGQYCIREPSDKELTDWMGGVKEELEQALQIKVVNIDQDHQQYVGGCVPL